MTNSGLGSDRTTCKNSFQDAMRERLKTFQMPDGSIVDASANVDKAPADENFAALGMAVYTILTKKAITVSDNTDDAAFWQWITAVNDWLAKLATWQQGVTQAVNNWQPTQPADQTFRTALLALAAPGTPPSPAPTKLEGRIQ